MSVECGFYWRLVGSKIWGGKQKAWWNTDWWSLSTKAIMARFKKIIPLTRWKNLCNVSIIQKKRKRWLNGFSRVAWHHWQLKGYVGDEEHVCWGLRASCWILNRFSSLEPKKEPVRLLKFNARLALPARAQGLNEVGPPPSPRLRQKQKVQQENMLARTSRRLCHLLRSSSSCIWACQAWPHQTQAWRCHVEPPPVHPREVRGQQRVVRRSESPINDGRHSPDLISRAPSAM